MIKNDALRRELGRAVRNFHFDQDEGGILFPRQGLIAYGAFEVENVTQGGKSIAPNLVVDQGLNHILDVVLGAVAKVSTWYLAPFYGNANPAANWTAANFDTNATEFINYDEAARQEFVDSAASGGVLGNTASRAEITVADGTAPGASGQDTIYGVGLLSSSTKEGTSGVLLSSARLGTARSGLVDGDVIALGYTLTLTDAS